MSAETLDDPQASNVPPVTGDHLNAQRFLNQYVGQVLYSPELRRWFIWNGTWFQEDRLDRVLMMAEKTIDNLRGWAAEASGDEFLRRSRHYRVSTSARHREALLSIAGTDPDVAVGVDELDSYPLLLACRNGTIDLTTGNMTMPNPVHKITRGIDIDYDPDARSELFENFIATTFQADVDLIGYVQRLLGYCLTGVVSDHILPVFVGQGANGKSTLIGVVQDLLGDHAITAPDGLLIQQRHRAHPEELAALRGRRMVVTSELEKKAVLAEQRVKMLTGGDIISAREMYGRRFNFQPTHKALLVTNHRPRIQGTDHAMWRRVKVVPFETIIPPDRQDPTLRSRLVKEHGAAVLSWLVRGAVEWHESGLGCAEAVTMATENYRRTEDIFATFLAECTVPIVNARTKVGDLWKAWTVWSAQSGEAVGRLQDFSAALENQEITIERGRNAVARGICLSMQG